MDSFPICLPPYMQPPPWVFPVLSFPFGIYRLACAQRRIAYRRKSEIRKFKIILGKAMAARIRRRNLEDV